jgi:glutamate racemase
LLKEKIEKYLPQNVKLLSQGEIVTHSLQGYLQRHIEIEALISKEGNRIFYTTDSAEDFTDKASIFFGQTVKGVHVDLQQ